MTQPPHDEPTPEPVRHTAARGTQAARDNRTLLLAAAAGGAALV
ncbi:hypothetical protein ABZ687_13205 [Streptomyces ardesiacus]